MRKAVWIALGLCLAFSGSIGAATASGKKKAVRVPVGAPVAIVSKVEGKALLLTGTTKPKLLDLGADIYAGQTIRVEKAKEGLVQLAWHKGPRFRLLAGASALVTPTGLKGLAGPTPVTWNGRKWVYRPGDWSKISNEIGGRSARSGGPRDKVPMRLGPPLGVTFETRPQFRWVCVAPADSYQITLYRKNEEHNALWTVTVKAPDAVLTYPAEKPALKPGEWYRWEVKVTSDNASEPPAEEAYFWVAPPQVKERLETLRAAAEAEPNDDGAQIILIRALWETWFFEEAVTEAKKWVEKNPGDASWRRLSEALERRKEGMMNGTWQEPHTNEWWCKWPWENK